MKEKLIISEKFSIEFIKKIHADLGHIGIKQMQRMISAVYTADNMTKNIKRICESCVICLKNKSRGQSKYGLMSHLGPATKPFQICSIDTIGGFGGSRSTKRYLHLLSDHFTRYAYVLTSSTQNANDFIKLIRNCAETDDIELILSDQYPGINSKEFKRFLDEKKIAIIFTSVNSPFSNGLNERLNQTLVNKIRCKINEHDTRIAWTTIAHDCVNKYNDTEHTVTGYAPSYLLYGKDVTFLPNELKQKKTEYDLIQARKKALENTIKSHNYNKTIYDKNRKHIDFKVGDIVL
ncbi:Transposon Tf2-11 polyprotein [Eumeta japonica]|uniref:RNA-directed DNA polymerase n=1 Tax=Eumeta variegata TaxID=151549 RepID=A0A4C1X2Q6_EUMVA|nr:Transposon Tf2-11 polyprotein [Eumeta japonica]